MQNCADPYCAGCAMPTRKLDQHSPIYRTPVVVRKKITTSHRKQVAASRRAARLNRRRR